MHNEQFLSSRLEEPPAVYLEIVLPSHGSWIGLLDDLVRAWPDVSQLALDVPDGYYTPGDSYGFAFTIESMGSLQRFSPGASTLAALERVVRSIRGMYSSDTGSPSPAELSRPRPIQLRQQRRLVHYSVIVRRGVRTGR